MALSKSGLKTRIINEFDAQDSVNTSNGFSYISKFAEALANAIIDEITSNAVVATTVTGTCPAEGGLLVNGAGQGAIS